MMNPKEYANQKCARPGCGDARMHHTSRGGIGFCAAVKSRCPLELCKCTGFVEGA